MWQEYGENLEKNLTDLQRRVQSGTYRAQPSRRRYIPKADRSRPLVRLEKFGLSLHPEKTRLVEFGRFAVRDRERRGLGKPETFDFLGFTHMASHTRQGYFQLKRKSRRDRMQAKLRELKEELRRRMHQPIPEQGQWLFRVVTGYFAYHAVPTNITSLGSFRSEVVSLWRTLCRQLPKVEARCVNCARRALCGWHSVMNVPTAMLDLPGGCRTAKITQESGKKSKRRKLYA
jgi:hypothetical protein